ncbi:hypothetical protein B0A55_03172 [Friedmanniomyces simplex]|uniref:Ima1 N-terminal domain-containing protein n=1 Tax=Friedmanniomyces simplex TaxID=329884 RepID=A0A4U0XFF6_9PEZI|nr:hypothetical protein B0A55_03172 [Friedmanniomyces simplex]
MNFLRRIYCHFCGTRSPYSKSSGIGEFQCTACEAVNYLDSNGDIIDTPATIFAQSQRDTREPSPPFQTFTQELPETLGHQQGQVFCNTCVNNQRMYMEALGNYLPDEDDPRYYEYEAAEGQFKQELEKRYPQVCRRCAPKAQGKINRADYYAGTQNINRRAEETARRGLRSARGTRDDWSKWSMRLILRVLGMVVYASLLLQAAWHVYGVFSASTKGITTEWEEDAGLAFDPMPHDCFQESLRLRFSHECHQVLGTYIPRALLASLALIWYNQGLKDWYHHSHRMEQVTGQTEHFRLQAVMLVVRAIAWFKLSDTTVAQSLTTQQLIAAHGFVAIFVLALQWLSNRTIKSIRFKLRQKMTPKPEERDVLGAYAGPENEEYERQASSIPPNQLLARDHIDRITPFPIANLAPRQSPRGRQTAATIPSPPLSEETDDEGDPMDIDDQSPAFQSQMPGAPIDRTYRPKFATKRTTFDARSLHNHGTTQPAGWSSMREEIFGLQDSIRDRAERKRQELEEKAKLKYQPPVQQSPFRGQLPPAPMSMERRLRNPVSQLAFKETPISKQQDFMQQMRSGIEQGKTFARNQENRQQTAQSRLLGNEGDDDFSPVKSRTRGGLDLKKSTWTLPADTAQQATGLEDLFGGNSFRIVDEPAITLPASSRRKNGSRKMLRRLALGMAVPVAVLAVSWNVESARRAMCLWLVDAIERMGY